MTAPSPHITLKRAGSSDFWRVYVYLRRLGEAEGVPIRLWIDAKTLLREWFGECQAEVVFAEVDGRPAGFVACFTAESYEFHNFLYISGIFVEPAFRGKGVGRVFIQCMLNRARELGRDGVAWCCLKDNRSALAFSEHVGANDCGEHTIVRMGVDTPIRVYSLPLKC